MSDHLALTAGTGRNGQFGSHALISFHCTLRGSAAIVDGTHRHSALMAPPPVSASRSPGPIRRALWLLLVYAMGTIAGLTLARLGTPLPFIVGPLLSTGLVSSLFGAPQISKWHRWSGQLIIASAVGLNLTPVAMSNVAANVVPMVIGGFATVAFSVLLATLLVEIRKVDRATALFASLPGGPIEMAGLADHYGGNGGVVAFSQTVRIAAIVIFIPPLLILSGETLEDVGTQVRDVDPLGLAFAILAALIGAWVFLRLKVLNPFFLGPLLGVGLITMLGLPSSPMPHPLPAMGQIAIGVALGAMFDRRTVIAAANFIGPSLAVGAMLLGLAFALGSVMSAALGEPLATLVLANAPGGTPEMAITATAMSLDASLVAAFHIVRILMILPLAALIFRLYDKVGSARSRRRLPPQE